MEKKDIKSMDLEELTQELLAMGEKKFRAGQIYGWMHVHLVRSIDEMTNISQKLREQLKENYAFTAVKLLKRQISRIDGTQKFLFRLADGNADSFPAFHHNAFKHRLTADLVSPAGERVRLFCFFAHLFAFHNTIDI